MRVATIALATHRVFLVVLMRSKVRFRRLDLLTRRKELLSGWSTPASSLVSIMIRKVAKVTHVLKRLDQSCFHGRTLHRDITSA